jgi:unsaturated rhamnogalacturonyl hydrolase
MRRSDSNTVVTSIFLLSLAAACGTVNDTPTWGASTGGEAGLGEAGVGGSSIGGSSTGGSAGISAGGSGGVTAGGSGGSGAVSTGGSGGTSTGGSGGISTGGSGGISTGGSGAVSTGGSGAVSTGGTSTGGAGGAGTGGATGGTGGGGGTAGATGGTSGAAGAGGAESCAYECVDECIAWGGIEREGTCEGEQVCCEGATVPENPLAHLVTSAEEVGLLLANRFNQQALAFNSVANLPGDGYKTACEWYGALGVASLTGSQSLLDSLVAKFDPLKGDFITAMTGGDAHVDRYIFGIVPLEIYLQTGDASYLPLGTETADTQQVTNQTRDAIDDMFMMTSLQVQAYRATGDETYLNFMSDIMVDYLGAQQQNGLFFHNVNEAPVHWGRGNGWFAAGMAEILRDLPAGSANYQTILDGYVRMMEGLLPLQGPNGLWYQVLDMPDDPSNWEETSCTGMFTYAMVAGVRRGILDAATYVPFIEAAWDGLQSKISPQGDVSDICTGTWYHATAQEYMALSRLTGDGHGQAPVLWVAAELLR